MRTILRARPSPRTDFSGDMEGRFITEGSSGSPPNATPGSPCVSMLTHRICAAFSGSGSPRNGPIRITATSAKPPESP